MNPRALSPSERKAAVQRVLDSGVDLGPALSDETVEKLARLFVPAFSPCLHHRWTAEFPRVGERAPCTLGRQARQRATLAHTRCVTCQSVQRRTRSDGLRREPRSAFSHVRLRPWGPRRTRTRSRRPDVWLLCSSR